MNREQRRLLGANGLDIDEVLKNQQAPPVEYTVPLGKPDGTTENTPVSVATVMILSGIGNSLAQIAHYMAVMSGQVYQPIEEDENARAESGSPDGGSSGSDGGADDPALD